MIGRDSSISEVFFERSRASYRKIIMMSVFVGTLALNIYFLATGPSWLKEIDYIEIMLFGFLIFMGLATYASVRSKGKQDNSLWMLGFERGEHFSYTLNGERINLEKSGDTLVEIALGLNTILPGP
ncbi:MAG: hypothetical protein GF416_09395 [Candidatus Altiarchaeales archaeon]|nr:hypothetical protein [Candidatus Altiarchaeales archaeon]MBD3417334.1 hypothetical protein [Candidatus Altiarchaeales archaeon]